MTFDTEKYLRHLDHRMQSVATLNWALTIRSQWQAAPPIAVHIDGKLTLEGNLNAITNPMLEVGLVHCRALMEFLGLCDEKGSLSQIKKRRPSDIGVEHFKNASGPLPMLSPGVAVSRYGGDADEAERALLSVFRMTNKGLAHSTSGMIEDPADFDLVEIASAGVPSLMVSYFYTPLGLPRPDSRISTRPRDE
ncbi:hypothetical protein GH983_09335 [Agrobacterium sp. MA01]|uniref:hypothetical protein n=1 Tax=Agrobacterium sp. MA01 TaxID=2664893 RepID=UPI00129B272A|nr:hypothetical protein [Agrobacterium sp. MA01]QGG90655.1 hypothetical protein GH983_09335 [Agrobacterium sp. MA01]